MSSAAVAGSSAIARRPGRSLTRQIFRRRARPAALGCAAVVVHQVCEALVPLAIGLAVDRAVDQPSGTAVLIAVLGVLGLFTVLAVAAAVGYRLLDVTCLRESHDLRVTSARALMRAEAGGPSRSTGEWTSVLTADAKAASEVIRVAGWLISAVVGLAVSAAVLLGIDLLLGIGVLVVLPVLVIGVDRLGPWIERRTHARQQTGGLAAGAAAEFVAGMRPLRGFGGVPEAVRRFRLVSRRSLGASVGAASAASVVTAAGLLATGILLVGIAAAATAMAVSGRISLGELITVVAMASFLADPVRMISMAVQQAAVSRASAARLEGIPGVVGPGTDGGRPAQRSQQLTEPAGPAGQPARPGAGPGADLIVEAVSAGPLHGVDLTVHAGDLVGVAAADPRVADLLAGLLGGTLRPDSGTVRWGSTDLADLPPALVRARILVEPHAVHLLGGTLAEVLDTGRDTPPVVLDAALQAAQTADIVDAPPINGSTDRDPDPRAPGTPADPAAPAHRADPAVTADPAGPTPGARGLHDTVQDHGTDLSGGQRQRVALARALAAEPPVLVLRDPLSAVDAVTEDAAAHGIRTLRADPRFRTVVITCSPLVLARCDRVLFLDGDGSAALGSHADLRERPDYAAAVLR